MGKKREAPKSGCGKLTRKQAKALVGEFKCDFWNLPENERAFIIGFCSALGFVVDENKGEGVVSYADGMYEMFMQEELAHALNEGIRNAVKVMKGDE